MNILNTFFNAIQSMNSNMIETLLRKFPNLANSKDQRGFSPLVFATYFDQKEITEIYRKSLNI